MAGWPTDRLTLNRTLADEIYAIVYKAIDRRPIPEAFLEQNTHVYADNDCCGTVSEMDLDSIITATNAELTGLENSERGGAAWPTPYTIVVNEAGNIVTSGD